MSENLIILTHIILSLGAIYFVSQNMEFSFQEKENFQKKNITTSSDGLVSTNIDFEANIVTEERCRSLIIELQANFVESYKTPYIPYKEGLNPDKWEEVVDIKEKKIDLSIFLHQLESLDKEGKKLFFNKMGLPLPKFLLIEDGSHYNLKHKEAFCFSYSKEIIKTEDLSFNLMDNPFIGKDLTLHMLIKNRASPQDIDVLKLGDQLAAASLDFFSNPF